MASPNMNMPIPVPTVTDGPTYAIQEVSCFEIIDSHNHAAGQGVPVPVSGLDINGVLPMNTNAIANCGSLNLTTQTLAPSASASVYNLNGDLYYKNGAGAAVQITSGGSIAAAAGNITGLAAPASASYGAGVFVFQSDAGEAANMDIRNLYLRNATVGSFRCQLSPPAAMANDYDLVLPPLPVSTKIMALDSSGNMSAPYSVDGSTIEISANVIQVKNGGITKPKLAALGQQLSGSCGTFTGSGINIAAVTNLSVTITTTGRPVMIQVIPEQYALGANSFIRVESTTAITEMTVSVLRGATTIANIGLGAVYADAGTNDITYPPSAVTYVDTPSAGTYTYSVYYEQTLPASSTTWSNCKLLVYEL